MDEPKWTQLFTVHDLAELHLALNASAPAWVEAISLALDPEDPSESCLAFVMGPHQTVLMKLEDVAPLWLTSGDGADVVDAVYKSLREMLN